MQNIQKKIIFTVVLLTEIAQPAFGEGYGNYNSNSNGNSNGNGNSNTNSNENSNGRITTSSSLRGNRGDIKLFIQISS